RWLTFLGLRVEKTSATTHDATVARLSHLIQLVAVTLGAEIAQGKSDRELEKLLALSGTSFRQLARLMASPAQLWKQIVGQNRQEIVPALDHLSTRLQALARSIESETGAAINETFAEANRIPPALR